MKNFLLILLYFINNVLVLSAQGTPGKWGDQGNGTYINPILNADYSDPDVIRVRDKYYMIASDFHFLGMQVLESSDMINWKLISQIYHHFDFPIASAGIHDKVVWSPSPISSAKDRSISLSIKSFTTNSSIVLLFFCKLIGKGIDFPYFCKVNRIKI